MLPVSTVIGTLELMKKVGEDGIVGHERARGDARAMRCTRSSWDA